MFNKFDLGQFVKTHLAQEIQKSQIGNFMKQKGAPPITASITTPKIGEKTKTADGIDMGQQVDAGVIPIIYGHVGMSNTQFDLGQKPSDVDAEFVTQEVKFPISEGPIMGLSFRSNGDGQGTRDPDNETFAWDYGAVDYTNILKEVVINDSHVIDPVTDVANFKDIKFEMTLGDGTTNKQSATISDYNPLLQEEDGDKIEAIDDPTDGKLLNDLGDVTAAKGVNYVLFWNTETGRWEAKSFNALLNETGATYDGGAGGSGGSGGDGGLGGLGGTGGGATSATAKTYTQWNPPPTHVETAGTLKTTTTITSPTGAGADVVSGKGAPLRRLDQTLPYFITEIDFADVDETVDTIDLTTFFPEGIYKEFETVSTTVDGTITLCGTERPITGSGNLDCSDLTPNVELAPDGQSATTTTRDTGSVRVYYVLTTTLCEGTASEREFILDQSSYSISHRKNGGYKHTKSIAPMSMNAGSRSRIDGIPQPNSISGANECNTTVLDDYNFKNYSLSDYLTTYPDQILKATNTIKVYAWFDNKDSDDEFTISTDTYLHAVEVAKPMDISGLYKQGTLTQSAYQLFKPDHGFKSHIADTESDSYDLQNNRKYTQFITGEFEANGAPDPLVVQDGLASTGSSGSSGNGGAAGAIGSGGSAGTQGSVTVPTLAPIPFVTGKDGSYPGDGVATTVTLPTIEVTNDDPSSTDTLTIAVSQGTLFAVTVPVGVSVGSTQNTSSLVLIGANPNIQTCLDSGIEFSSTTATIGDVALTLTISKVNTNGSSLDNRTIRSSAVTEYVAPTFTITVNDYVGTFDAFVRGNAIMVSITGATSNDATATLIAEAITSYSSIPNWTATVSGNVVTCTGPVGLGNSYNGILPTYTGTMDATITEIAGGVSPSRVTQPKQSTKNIKGKFIPALAFTNTLDASDVSFAQIKYRPEQGDGEATLSEIGFFIGGRDQIEEPSNIGVSFDDWQAAGYTSTKGWSSNTAWVFFDYLTNTTFGLGNDIVLDDQQKADLYEDIYLAARWTNLAPDSGQPLIPVSRFNGIIYGAESKFEALQKIADAMFAKFVYLNGNPRLVFDGRAFAWSTYTPTIKKLVNQTSAANIMYQSGSIDNIFNVINVTWNNPANYFRTENVQYKNTASIAKYGERETSIELTGCTNKQMALWHGAWMYETEASNAETVTYIAGWDHFDVLPGDLIHLNDGLRVDTTTVGARVSAVGATLTLDRDCGVGTIAVTDTSGNIQQGSVNGTSALMLAGTFQVDAVANVYSGTFEANYRVIAIEESEDGIYAVTAQKHDPDKYTRIWANTV